MAFENESQNGVPQIRRFCAPAWITHLISESFSIWESIRRIAIPHLIFEKDFPSDQCFLSIALPTGRRIREIMANRRLKMGDVMFEMCFLKLNTSLGMALHRNTQLQPDLLVELEKWLDANQSVRSSARITDISTVITPCNGLLQSVQEHVVEIIQPLQPLIVVGGAKTYPGTSADIFASPDNSTHGSCRTIATHKPMSPSV